MRIRLGAAVAIEVMFGAMGYFIDGWRAARVFVLWPLVAGLFLTAMVLLVTGGDIDGMGQS